MRKKNPEDVARVRRFQAWIKEQMDARGLDYTNTRDRQRVADNFNSTRDDDEPTITESQIRRLIDREEEIATVQRSTCRTVALGLNLDINEVLIQAGYLPSDKYLQLDELPIEIRIEYSRLSEEQKKRIHRFISFEYQEAKTA